MRKQECLLVAALFALLAVGSHTAVAGDWLGGQYWGNISGCSDCGGMGYGGGGYGGGGCGAGGCGSTMGCGHGCGLCGFLHHGLHGRHIEGSEPGFNCGCNGSYNYPVPPLYTYHWPGMYKQQLMTNYQSPWRFPPIQPYTDELPVRGDEPPALPTTQRISPLIPAAALLEVEPARIDYARPGDVEPLSEKMRRAFQ